MQKLNQTLILSSFLLLFYSCNKNQSPSTIAQSSSYSDSQPPNIAPEIPKSDRFVIAPEIALVTAKMQATGNSFDRTFESIDVNAEKLQQSINNTDGCQVELLDYQHPVVARGQRVLDGSEYRTHLDFQITISFDGDNSVRERIEQLNNCLQAIPRFELDNSKNSSINLNLSQAIPTVIDTSKYRKQLLETKFKPLQEIAELSETPSQFNATNTKCTSKGNVQIISRSISNIELDIDFNCQQFNNANKSQ